MRELTFKTLHLTHFTTFVMPNVVQLDLSPGLYFVGGRNEFEPALQSNGSGKSSIWDALCWCLHGTTPDGRRNPDIRPWFGSGEQTIVAVHTNEATYARTAEPNSASAHKIGIDFDLFTNTILLGQGRPLFYDLGPKEKLELFATVLNLNCWEKRAQAAHKLAQNYTSELAELIHEERACAAQLTQLDALLAQNKKRSDEWEADYTKKVAEAQEELSRWEEALSKKEEHRNEADLIYDSAMTEARAYNTEVAQLITYLEGHKDALLKEEARVKADFLRAEDLKAELESLGKTDTCPVCKQDIKGTSLAKHKAELRERVRTLMKSHVPPDLVTSVRDIEEQITTARKHYSEWSSKALRAEGELEFWKGEVEQIRSKVTAAKALVQVGSEMQNPHRTQRMELVKSCKEVLKNQNETVASIRAIEANMKRTEFWVKEFRSVALSIIEEVLEEYELATNAMLESVGLFGWRVSYAVEKETKSGTIQRGINVGVYSPRNEKMVRWQCWSGGQGQRLRVIGALALSDVLLNHAGIRSNLEILDEPTQHLARQGVRDLCEFLAQRAAEQEKVIFYCDHQSVQSTHFSGVLTVVNGQEGSYIE